jgi:hypothetical protein
MERAIRPELRPRYRTRWLIALTLSIWAVLQGLTLAVAAIRGGPASSAMTFLLTGVLTLYLVGASLVAWAWARRARPTSYATEGDEPITRHHRGLTGEESPPTRW